VLSVAPRMRRGCIHWGPSLSTGRNAAERALKARSAASRRPTGPWVITTTHAARLSTRALLPRERSRTTPRAIPKSSCSSGTSTADGGVGRGDSVLREAAASDPGWQNPLLNLSQAQLWMRRYEEAERTSRRALALDRGTPCLHDLGVRPLLRDGDWRRSSHRAGRLAGRG